MPDHTPYQKKIIERYYDHRGDIMLTRLAEIVSDLFLADSEVKVKRLWSRAEAAMRALKVPETLIEHVVAQKKPELLAAHLRDWQSGKPPKR